MEAEGKDILKSSKHLKKKSEQAKSFFKKDNRLCHLVLRQIVLYTSIFPKGTYILLHS